MSKSTGQTQPNLIRPQAASSAEALRSLFEGKVQGMIATLHLNERPLRGLVGWLDWRFHGAISHAIRRGAVSGASGECTYFPLSLGKKGGTSYPVILLGLGSTDTPGARRVPEPGELKLLRKNLTGLRFERLGISMSDFGNPKQEDFIKTHLGGAPLCVLG